MKWKIVILLALILAIGSAQAVNIQSGVISISGISSTVNVTHPWNLEKLTVNNSAMRVDNITGSNPNNASKENLTYIFDEQNKTYNGKEFPYFAISNITEKHIDSNITKNLNITAEIFVLDCSTLESISYRSHTGTFTQSFTDFSGCSNELITLDVNNIENSTGSNILFIEYLSFNFSVTCFNNSMGVEVFSALTNVSSETPINQTLTYTTNIITDYSVKGAEEIYITLSYNDSHFEVIDNYTTDGTVSDDRVTINRFTYDVPTSTEYTVAVTGFNSSLGLCQANYNFAVQRQEGKEKGVIILIFVGLFAGLVVVTKIAGGILLRGI